MLRRGWVWLLLCLPWELWAGVSLTPLPLAEPVPGLDKIRPGQGAILVPSLTTSKAEPLWRLQDERGRKVGSAPTGHAIVVAPGIYTAIVGSGSGSQLTRVRVEVCEGQVARVEPTWGALVVHTLDEEETPLRGLYLLFEFLTRDSYGFGRGAEEEVGEVVDTWLLKPSIYKIVGPLEGFDAKINFTTLQIEPGRVLNYVLVTNRESGDFLGSGVAPSGDFTVRGSITGRPPRIQTGGFKLKVQFGGDFSQSASENVLGVEGNSLGFGLFTDFSANYLRKKNFFNLFLNLAGGIRKNSDESFVRKIRDEISLSTIYIHQTWPRLGGYLRLSGTTQFASTFVRYETPRLVAVNGEPPELVDRLKTSSALDPIFLEMGAGFNSRLLKTIPVDIDVRAGVSYRRTVTGGFLVRQEDPLTEAEDFARVGGSGTLGGEIVLLGSARLTQLAAYRLDANVFLARQPRLDFQNTLSVRLFKSFSVGVLIALKKDETTSQKLGFSEAFFLRATKRVF